MAEFNEPVFPTKIQITVYADAAGYPWKGEMTVPWPAGVNYDGNNVSYLDATYGMSLWGPPVL
jgi:hypothetical protein